MDPSDQAENSPFASDSGTSPIHMELSDGSSSWPSLPSSPTAANIPEDCPESKEREALDRETAQAWRRVEKLQGLRAKATQRLSEIFQEEQKAIARAKNLNHERRILRKNILMARKTAPSSGGVKYE